MSGSEQFVTLIDGREFPAGCVLVRHELEVMADHMQRMRGIRNAADRRVYLEGVERSQGKAWRDALAAEYATDWERRKGGEK